MSYDDAIGVAMVLVDPYEFELDSEDYRISVSILASLLADGKIRQTS